MVDLQQSPLGDNLMTVVCNQTHHLISQRSRLFLGQGQIARGQSKEEVNMVKILNFECVSAVFTIVKSSTLK